MGIIIPVGISKIVVSACKVRTYLSNYNSRKYLQNKDLRDSLSFYKKPAFLISKTAILTENSHFWPKNEGI